MPILINYVMILFPFPSGVSVNLVLKKAGEPGSHQNFRLFSVSVTCLNVNSTLSADGTHRKPGKGADCVSDL